MGCVPGCTGPADAQCRDAFVPAQYHEAGGLGGRWYPDLNNDLGELGLLQSCPPWQPGTRGSPPTSQNKQNWSVWLTHKTWKVLEKWLNMHINKETWTSTLLSCMSRLAPFLSSTKVASTLLTAAAQCKADLPEVKMRVMRLNSVHFMYRISFFPFINKVLYYDVCGFSSYHGHPQHWHLHGSAPVPPPCPPLPVWLPGWVAWCRHSYGHQDPWHGYG